MAATLQPDRPATLRFAFPPDLSSARAAASTVRGFFAEQGVSDKELFACEVCVAEACNNAVEYATPEGRVHHAVVDALCSATLLELRVSDHTAGFEWPKGLMKPPMDSDRGRGLFIIQSFMVEVQYLRGPKENVLIMRKKRSGAAQAVDTEKEPRNFDESQRLLGDCKRAISAMARELCFRSETLSAVFRCCAELGSSSSSAGFAERLLADMLHLTSADWYVLRLVSSDHRQLTIAAVSSPELKAESLDFPTADSLPRTAEAIVAATRQLAHFEAGKSASDEPLRAAGANANGVVYPLTFNGALVGTVSVGRRQGNFAFGDLSEEVVKTFAEFLAIQTVNMRHREEDIRGRLFSQELDIARVVQRSLLPVSLPQVPGFGLAGGWHCAREVGGDFYDAIALNENCLLLMVADVMGKGVPAALFATNLRGLLRGLAARFDDPGMLLGRLNALLYEELSAASMFITAQVAVVDARARTITAAGAGHCPLLYTPASGPDVTTLVTQGMPLGVLSNETYRAQKVALGRPGTVLLYTDGLTDVRNATGQTFGPEALADWLRRNHGHGRSATEMRGRLAAELSRYRGDTAMTDDQAFLLLTEDRPEATRDPSSWFPKAHARAAAGSLASAWS